MTIAQHFDDYVRAIDTCNNAARWDALCAARAYLKRCTETDWQWLESALADGTRKLFVAWVFDRESVPRRLLAAMVKTTMPA